MRTLTAPLIDLVDHAPRLRCQGEVVRVNGLTIEAAGLRAETGAVCVIERAGRTPISAQVVGFSDGRLKLAPLGETEGVAPGALVRLVESQSSVPFGVGLLGRVLDGLGRPIDGRGPLVEAADRRPLVGPAPHPLGRTRISEPLATGVRAIDGLLTVGKGQRLGIFAGSGVGKSSLLAMLARHMSGDVNVLALIGERGREVQEFIDDQLGPEGLARSVVVVATSDQPALLRRRAAFAATAIAEGFRDAGADVLLLMDSVTRLAMAQREIGLSALEAPALRGYPPSVFELLPRLLERAGNSDRGTMTAFYTVLVEGDDFEEPVSDALRAILDGHIVLSRELAERNHYPAIDVLASLSRVMPLVTGPEQRNAAATVRALLAEYAARRDFVEIGSYKPGTNALLDAALAAKPGIDAFLRQGLDEHADLAAMSSASARDSVRRASPSAIWRMRSTASRRKPFI
jgi:flagellum-specific ATP synthase